MLKLVHFDITIRALLFCLSLSFLILDYPALFVIVFLCLSLSQPFIFLQSQYISVFCCVFQFANQILLQSDGLNLKHFKCLYTSTFLLFRCSKKLYTQYPGILLMENLLKLTKKAALPFQILIFYVHVNALILNTCCSTFPEIFHKLLISIFNNFRA